MASSAVAPITGNGNNMPSVSDSAVHLLGKGSYGCVVKPAFSNVDDFGRPVHFPNNVTKIYSDEEEASKAERDSDILYSLDPRVAIPIHKYKKKFTRRNIPDMLRTKCNIDPGNNLTAPIYPVRMPYLGVSLYDVKNSREHMGHIQTLDPRIFFQHVRHLFEIVATYRRGQFIHGDIRQPNVMIFPSGKMTIIDYDWFYKQDSFLYKYTGVGYYSNPMETCLWNEEFFKAGKKLDIVQFNRLAERYTRSYRESQATQSYPVWLKRTDVLATALEDIHSRFMETHASLAARPRFREFRKVSIDTFDSFGLAMTLIYFIDGYLPGWSGDRAALRTHLESVHGYTVPPAKVTTFMELVQRLYSEVFVQMVHWNNLTRMRIDAAIAKLDEFRGDLDTLFNVAGGQRISRRDSRKVKN